MNSHYAIIHLKAHFVLLERISLKKQIIIDEFFERQPSLEFINDLKMPVHTEASYNFSRTISEKGEVCVIYFI